MEANDNLERCMSLVNGSEAFKHICNFESSFIKECAEQDSTDCLTKSKRIDNRNNEIMNIQIPIEILNECSSETSTKLLRKLSLNPFDSLHSEHQSMETSDDSYNTYNIRKSTENSSEIYDAVFSEEKVNKTPYNSYADDALISLESPKKIAKAKFPRVLLSDNTKPVKKYSQEEFRQLLSIQELYLQKKFSQTVLESEKSYAIKYQELYSELSKLSSINRCLNLILSEMFTILENTKISNEKNKAKLEDFYVSNEKLKLDITALREDLCSMESVFSEIYKPYETSKSMIKNYKENEKRLTKNIESMKFALLGEKEAKNDVLKSPNQELTNALAKEIDVTKKSSDTQILILKTQLKKCEIKIESLENDLTLAKSNSGKFGGICEDLMESFPQSS